MPQFGVALLLPRGGSAFATASAATTAIAITTVSGCLAEGPGKLDATAV